MTATAIDTGTGATHLGRRSFLWMAALTALWIILNYWQPGIQASGVPGTPPAVCRSSTCWWRFGLWLGLEKTTLSMSQRRNVWLAVMVPYTLWLSAIWNMAIYGVFRPSRRSAAAASGDFPAGDYRHTDPAALEANG